MAYSALTIGLADDLLTNLQAQIVQYDLYITAPFREGDIYIDPARQRVEVRGQPVSLRHREFSLLLYFMRNPNIVLTPSQICEHAYGMEYTQPIDRAVHELRKQIEANPSQPCYIQTVYRVGYRFTAYSSETCDR